jgi:hypothetical protein
MFEPTKNPVALPELAGNQTDLKIIMRFIMTDILLQHITILYPMPDGEILRIPDDEMIAEATIPHPLTPEFACRILNQYTILDKTKILEIIDKNSDNFWEELCTELSSSDVYYPTIYPFFSLQKHRTTQQSPSRSKSVFMGYSDMVVKGLSLKRDPLLVAYCDLAELDYDAVAYYKFICSWCDGVFPQPLNYIENIDMEYKIREQLPSEFIKDIENSGSTFDNLPGIFKDLKPYLNKREEADRRLDIRFSKRAFFRNSIEQIDRKFAITRDSGKSILSEYHDSKFKEKAARENKNRVIILPNDNLTPPLYQCQFCFSYRRGEEQTRKQSITPWHCPMDDCKKAYDRWKKDLTRKGISLETLRQSGF